MAPKIADWQTWQQAELLMQPAFIRVIDHLRRQLEQSDWQGTYQEVTLWPEGTSEATKTEVSALLVQLQQASEAEKPALEAAIAALPAPYSGYHLCLSRSDQQYSFDLWELCYRICFCNYPPEPASPAEPPPPPQIDPQLLEATGEVDWQNLDIKTRSLVEQLFANLPPLA